MGTNNKKTPLTAFVDSIFVVGGEMIDNNGEDSFAYALNDECGFIGVFDGCGGIGSRKYEVYSDKTGAYIASHVCSETMLDWFGEFSASGREISANNIKYICDSLKERFTNELDSYEDEAGAVAIKGSLAKKLPTTASLVMFTSNDSKMYAAYVWAGDSRGFVLNESGLTQVTTDDIEVEGDAMENLSNDSKLTNMVCAGGDFHFNNRILTDVDKGMFITATDGFFSYFSTPMEFEFMIVDTLLVSDSVASWKVNLCEFIKKYTADDYTMGVTVFGYKSFKALKKAYVSRHAFLVERYIKPLETLSDEEKVALWNEYKTNYYRGE